METTGFNIVLLGGFPDARSFTKHLESWGHHVIDHIPRGPVKIPKDATAVIVFKDQYNHNQYQEARAWAKGTDRVLCAIEQCSWSRSSEILVMQGLGPKKSAPIEAPVPVKSFADPLVYEMRTEMRDGFAKSESRLSQAEELVLGHDDMLSNLSKKVDDLQSSVLAQVTEDAGLLADTVLEKVMASITERLPGLVQETMQSFLSRAFSLPLATMPVAARSVLAPMAYVSGPAKGPQTAQPAALASETLGNFQAFPKRRAMELAGEVFGVSRDMVWKAERVAALAPEVFQAMKDGLFGSVNDALRVAKLAPVARVQALADLGA